MTAITTFTSKDNDGGADGALRCVTLELCGQTIAVPVARVRRVCDPLTIAHLPDAPGAVLGMVDFEGRSIAVVDLAGQLGLVTPSGASSGRMVIVEVGADGTTEVCVSADKVLDVIEIPDHAIGPVPCSGGRKDGATDGVARINGELVLIVAPERLFSTLDTDPFDFR